MRRTCGVRNGLPQARHGGPYKLNRWCHTVFMFVSSKRFHCSEPDSLARRIMCCFPGKRSCDPCPSILFQHRDVHSAPPTIKRFCLEVKRALADLPGHRSQITSSRISRPRKKQSRWLQRATPEKSGQSAKPSRVKTSARCTLIRASSMLSPFINCRLLPLSF